MRYAAITPEGLVRTLHLSLKAAQTAAAAWGLSVQPFEGDPGEALSLRWNGTAWEPHEAPDFEAQRRAGWDRARRRVEAYDQRIERNLQFEVLTEVVFALHDAGALDGLLAPGTETKLAELRTRIQSVKTDHP